MKQCSRCRRWLEPLAFTVNAAKRDGLQNNCRDCQRAYARKHYGANRTYYIAKAKISKKKFELAARELLRQMKAVPCANCGGIFPPHVMDFDHVEGDKLFNLSRGYRLSRRGMLLEAAKCEIVCSNCHRERTHRRNQAPIAQPG